MLKGDKQSVMDRPRDGARVLETGTRFSQD